MRTPRCSLLVLWLLACASPSEAPEVEAGGVELEVDDAQARYTYPGCPNQDYHCARLQTAYCALEALRQQHDSHCTQASDCVLVPLERDCTGSSACGGLPIHSAGAAALRTEAQAEVNRYCGTSPTCSSMPSCVPTEVVCRAGRCGVAMVTPDGSGT